MRCEVSAPMLLVDLGLEALIYVRRCSGDRMISGEHQRYFSACQG